MAFIPFTPSFQTWDNWSSLIIEAFADQPLPMVPEDQWRMFGDALCGNPAFQEFAVPSPDKYENWQSWVLEVLQVTNGNYN